MDRGLLAGYDIDALKRQTRTQPHAALWNYLTDRVLGVAQRCREQGKMLDQGSLAWHSVTPFLVEAALIDRLSGNEEARAHALACIDNLVNAYGGIPTADELKNKPRSRAEGGHLARPKVLSHGEVALAADILRDSLPENTRETVRQLMKTTCIPFTNFEHGLAGYSSGGNVVLCQNLNAAICALTWGEESGFDGWERVVDNACDVIRQYLRNGSDEEGFSYEGSGYGLGVMSVIFLFCHLLRGARWHDDVLKTEPRLRLIPDAYRHMVLPDGRTATTGDSGCLYVGKWWLLMLADEFDRPDLRGEWEYTAGPDHPIAPYGDRWPQRANQLGDDPRIIEGTEKTLLMSFLHWNADAPVQPFEHASTPTAVCAEGTGSAFFRTSWRKDAIHAGILGAGRSRACFGHAHADCGHINLTIGNEYLAVDTGRYNWPEDQHSVVLVDGQNAEPLPAALGMGCAPTYGHLGQFQRHRMLDYCVADAASMKNAAWALRHFLFLRTIGDDAYVVLLDNINTDYGKAPHEYWWQLQCATTARPEITGDTTATVHGENARIDCSFFQKPEAPTPDVPHSISIRTDEMEWVWPYGREQDARTVECLMKTGEATSSVRRPRLLAIQKTLSCMLLSVLSPRRKGQPHREIRSLPVTNGIGIEVRGDGFTDTILVAPDHKLILTEELKCFSELAVIRRDPAGALRETWTSSGEPIQFKTTLSGT